MTVSMTLDREVEQMLAALAEAGPFGDRFDPVSFRAQFEQMSPGLWDPQALPVHHWQDMTIPAGDHALAARVYWPRRSKDWLPVLLFFHGGGYCSGSIHTAAAHARFLCREADCIVVTASYRLAPEHPFPAGVEDAFVAADWLVHHAADLGGDPARLAIGGDAPGASFAACCAIRARDQGSPFRVQLLLGPSTDFYGDYPEKLRNLRIGPVTAPVLAALEEAYLPDAAARADWRCSPLRAESLGGLPPVYILAAQYDFLRPETDAFVDRLRAEGTDVTYQVWPGTVHNFFSMSDRLLIARSAMRHAARHLRRALHPASI
ncbi:alpha/beta hydrolase [Govanella unica]|uniref:Alpha/beta hydrolase n=1 Tax=Govanella unica TaxID=2975056 RepID=A0A9X3TVK9_9PROT|nr:alpha/beta hydrolase [Govania unica]MDA5192565.1 alpha/beta hydrolase [Govania unica]